MKTCLTFLAIAILTLSVDAQTKEFPFVISSAHTVHVPVRVLSLSTNRSIGDTLMYMPLMKTYVNSADSANFAVTLQDVDMRPVNTIGADPDFGILSSTDSTMSSSGNPLMSNFYHPWESPAPAGNDTSFFWYATSWFNPIGQADNWLNFGPITIPGNGANLIWYDRTNPGWRDGYRVLVSATPSAVLTHTDFTDPPIYTKPDSYPSVTLSTDTNWVMREINIPSIYNGHTVSFAFNHNATNMDELYLDEITIVEGNVGISENEFVNGIKLSQNMPNPFSNVTTINYELINKSEVDFLVYDVTGKKVAEQQEDFQAAGKHFIRFNASDLSAGVYYYNLKIGENPTLPKKMIVLR